MVDRNNLNRIKGILSARKGAEIPKFQNLASPLLWSGYGSNEIKYHKKKGNYSIYSNDGVNWFQDIGLAIPHPNNDTTGFIDVNQVEVRPPLEIPGANPSEGNPTAAVIRAAATNAAVASEKDSQIVAQTVQAQQTSSTLTPAETKIDSNPNRQAPEVTVPKPIEQNPSAGLNLTPEQTKESKKAQGWGMAGQALSGVFNAVGDAVGAK